MPLQLIVMAKRIDVAQEGKPCRKSRIGTGIADVFGELEPRRQPGQSIDSCQTEEFAVLCCELLMALPKLGGRFLDPVSGKLQFASSAAGWSHQRHPGNGDEKERSAGDDQCREQVELEPIFGLPDMDFCVALDLSE